MKTEEAISFYSGHKGLADAIGITAQSIYEWGEHPPKRAQWEIQAATRGALRIEPWVLPKCLRPAGDPVGRRRR